jgi:hypothetical protein
MRSSQLSSWFDDNDERTRAYDALAKRRTKSGAAQSVALQSVHGYDEIWNVLARVIETRRRLALVVAASSLGTRDQQRGACAADLA